MEQPRRPLAQQVEECMVSWFQETKREAKSGNWEQMMLLSLLYRDGYGVRANVEEALYWRERGIETARSHGITIPPDVLARMEKANEDTDHSSDDG